jgi:hypothetical protein
MLLVRSYENLTSAISTSTVSTAIPLSSMSSTFSKAARSSLIRVPVESNIQDAIDNAEDGDILSLGAGTYSVSSTIVLSKAVGIVGVSGQTFIDIPSCANNAFTSKNLITWYLSGITLLRSGLSANCQMSTADRNTVYTSLDILKIDFKDGNMNMLIDAGPWIQLRRLMDLSVNSCSLLQQQLSGGVALTGYTWALDADTCHRIISLNLRLDRFGECGLIGTSERTLTQYSVSAGAVFNEYIASTLDPQLPLTERLLTALRRFSVTLERAENLSLLLQ